MVWQVDEEKLMVAALRQVMWCVESLARAAFDTSDVAVRLGWNDRDERRVLTMVMIRVSD